MRSVLRSVRLQLFVPLGLLAVAAPMASLSALQLGGRLTEEPHRGQLELRITLPHVREWMGAAGSDMTQEFDLFDEKFFVVFTERD